MINPVAHNESLKQQRHNNSFSRTLRSVYIGLVCALLLGTSPSTNARSVALQESTDAAVYNAKGLELFKSGRYEEAVNSYKEAIKLKKDYAEAHYNLGDVYFKLNQFKQAIDAYKLAVKYQPNFPTAYNNLGTAHFKLREHKKAIEAFKTGIRLDPKVSSLYFNLGATYVDRGNEKAAVEQYKILKNIDAQQAQKLYLIITKPLAGVFDATSGVRLNVIALDAQGNVVENLNPDDFQVIEHSIAQTSPSTNQNDLRIVDDNTPQSITTFSKEAYPLVYGLVVDTSGSMRTALQMTVDLSKAFVENNRPEDETLIVRFIDSDSIEIITDFTSDKRSLKEGLDTLYVEGGQSAVIDAVHLAAQRVAQYKPEHSPYLRRAMILITDGDERESYYTLNTLVEMLRAIDIQIFTICLGKDESDGSQLNNTLTQAAVPLLTTLAKETGGLAFFPKSASDLSSIAKRIMSMSRTQYLIEYKPTNPAEPSSYRSLTVKIVDKPGRGKIDSVVRAGYSVPKAKPTP